MESSISPAQLTHFTKIIMPLTIAIIGAGPAGCMLARLLPHSKQADNIDVKIFEIEASINYRSQGGSLDLHVKSKTSQQ